MKRIEPTREQMMLPLAKEQIIGLVKMQHSLNTVSYPAWLTDAPDYKLAACAELMGEALEHTPWKWWKKGELHTERLFLELIDVLHFVISDLIVVSGYNIEKAASSLHDCAEHGKANYHYVLQIIDIPLNQVGRNSYIKELTCALLSENRGGIHFVIAQLFTFMHRIGYTSEDIYLSYIGKNVLNRFRQNNGYKQGTYTKVWDTIVDANEKVIKLEDNDFLQAFLRDNVTMATEELAGNANAYLEDVYIAKGFKV